MTTQEQLSTNGILFLVLAAVLWLISDISKSYDLKEGAGFLGLVSLAIAVVSFFVAIWGPGLLYG